MRRSVEAWRYWRIVGRGQLAAPHAGDVLPADGLLRAECNLDHRPPAVGCRCGVHFHEHRALLEAVRRFDLTGGEYAFTVGTATPPIFGDALPLARVGFRWVACPRAWRARQYQVNAVYSDAPLTYDLPAHRLAAMPGL